MFSLQRAIIAVKLYITPTEPQVLDYYRFGLLPLRSSNEFHFSWGSGIGRQHPIGSLPIIIYKAAFLCTKNGLQACLMFVFSMYSITNMLENQRCRGIPNCRQFKLRIHSRRDSYSDRYNLRASRNLTSCVSVGGI